jgi:hypothetical protein
MLGGLVRAPCWATAEGRRVGRPRKGAVLGGGAAEAEQTRRRRRCRGGGGGQMRRSSEGAAGGPHHTHTLDVHVHTLDVHVHMLDVHVEAGPKTEGRPPPAAGRRAHRPPPPPPPCPGSVCGMHAWYAHTCERLRTCIDRGVRSRPLRQTCFPTRGRGMPLAKPRTPAAAPQHPARSTLINQYGASTPDLN